MLSRAATLHNYLLFYAHSLRLIDQTQRFHWLIVQCVQECLYFAQGHG